jgi:hypothetical protein
VHARKFEVQVSSFNELFPQSAPLVADWETDDLERGILARLSGASIRDDGAHKPAIHIHLRDTNGETIGTATGTASTVVSEEGDVLFGGCTLGDLVLDGLLAPVRVSLVDAAESDSGIEVIGGSRRPGSLLIR